MVKEYVNQDELVLKAKNNIGDSSIGDYINSGELYDINSPKDNIKEELRKFTIEKVFTGEWKPVGDNAIKIKDDLVYETIKHIVMVDKLAIASMGKTTLSDKKIPSDSMALSEFIEQEKARCHSDRKDHGGGVQTYHYSNPSTLSHLMNHHPKCISPDNKKEIIELEANYQKQEFGALIKGERSEKVNQWREGKFSEKKREEFSPHEKAAMKLLYDKKNNLSTSVKEYKITKDDISIALVEARSKTMRGKFTNMKRSASSAKVAAAYYVKMAISKVMSKGNGQSR